MRRSIRIAVVSTSILIAACGGGGTSPSAAPSGGSPAAGVIEVAASEYKFDPSAIEADAGSVAFRVTNVGAEEHEFEIFSGETVVDEVEGLVPGLSRDLTVTLEAGEYTYVCKLPGHEEQGMKGTLSVS